jgi:hypothetical protein
MPLLRVGRRLRGPPSEWCAPLPVQGLQKGFLDYLRNALFASHKLPLRGYLAAIAVFCNEVKGKSALALSRDLGLNYKSAFVLLHKLLKRWLRK